MNVSECMTGPADELVCAVRTDSLSRMASLIAHHNVGALPIVDDRGALCGVISERDIVRALAMDGHAALALAASELMTREVVTCRPGASLEAARRLMIKHRIRHLPVTGEDGELLGILSQRDLIAARGHDQEAGQAA